ncbi:hypothetical protein ACFW04_010306 [Cataglyphis niger]
MQKFYISIFSRDNFTINSRQGQTYFFSGAGKTTFLAALARRLKLTLGTVKINGHDVSKETMAEISNYMPQFDALPSALTPREYMSFVLSVIFVSIFYVDATSSTQEGIRSVRGALYMMISEIIFTVAYSVIYELPGEFVLYLRESTVYAPGPYYFAITLGSIPKGIFKAFLFTVVIYFLLHSEFSLLDFCLYCLCTATAAICSTAYGMMTSSWISNIDIVTTLMVPLDLLLLLTAGVFYNLRTLPSYLGYFKYMSIFYYATEAVSIIHWSGIKSIDCPVNRDLPCLSNGTEVLSEYGYNDGNFWWDITGLLLLTILMNIVVYFGIKRRRASRSII